MPKQFWEYNYPIEHEVQMLQENVERLRNERDDYKRRWEELHDVTVENVRLRSVLEFYANPWAHIDKGKQVPDFYSELDFGLIAEQALKKQP